MPKGKVGPYSRRKAQEKVPRHLNLSCVLNYMQVDVVYQPTNLAHAFNTDVDSIRIILIKALLLGAVILVKTTKKNCYRIKTPYDDPEVNVVFLNIRKGKIVTTQGKDEKQEEKVSPPYPRLLMHGEATEYGKSLNSFRKLCEEMRK